MKIEIVNALKKIESEERVNIVFACESGSRAWGFASADSDYDVRFIYAQAPERYCGLSTQSDTLERLGGNLLDLSGWDIRKALTHFAKSNPTLYEWFDSPQIYCSRANFAEKMRGLTADYFNARKALHHYYALAEKFAAKFFDNGEIVAKKLLYILRALLACEWILRFGTMPPTAFVGIYKKVCAPSLAQEVEALVRLKSTLTEKNRVKVGGEIFSYLETALKSYPALIAQVRPKRRAPLAQLEDICIKTIFETPAAAEGDAA